MAMWRSWVGALLAAAGVVRGDVVHLQNGRAIQGQVLERRWDGEVVLATAGGRMQIPAAQVIRIERESRGELLLAEGRRAGREGDPQAARRLLLRALDQGEGQAAKELALLGGGVDDERDASDPALRLGEAARALALGQPERARRLAESVRGDRTGDRDLRQRAGWVLGRALEELGEPAAAREVWRGVLGRLDAPQETDVLRELARLRWLGFPLREGAPGLGRGWAVVATPRVLVVARPDLAPALPARVEATLADVARRLELPDLGPGKRLTLFVHDDLRAYRASQGGVRWAAGHAARASATGEVARVVHLPREGVQGSALAHELAHVLLSEALAGHPVPRWLHEGVAIRAEDQRSRDAWCDEASGLPVEQVLAVTREERPGEDAPLALVSSFYARAALLFELLAGWVGPRRAIELALEACERGVELVEVLPPPPSDAAPPPPPRLR